MDKKIYSYIHSFQHIIEIRKWIYPILKTEKILHTLILTIDNHM